MGESDENVQKIQIPGGLSPKQYRFVCEYMIDHNGSQAYIRAGYSPNGASEGASRLLANVRVARVVAQLEAEAWKRLGVDAQRVREELAKVALANAGDIIDAKDANVLPGASRHDTAAIKSVKVKRIPTEDGDIVERQVELHDKIGALKLLGQDLGMFKEIVKLEETVSSFERLASGEFDNLPEQAFFMAGGIDDVVENAKKLQS
jgi:phage terminase small subunit